AKFCNPVRRDRKIALGELGDEVEGFREPDRRRQRKMESWSASPERGIYVTNDLGRREVGLVDAVHDLWLDLWFRLPKKHDRLNDILHVDHGLFVSAVPHREKSSSCDL